MVGDSAPTLLPFKIYFVHLFLVRSFPHNLPKRIGCEATRAFTSSPVKLFFDAQYIHYGHGIVNLSSTFASGTAEKFTGYSVCVIYVSVVVTIAEILINSNKLEKKVMPLTETKGLTRPSQKLCGQVRFFRLIIINPKFFISISQLVILMLCKIRIDNKNSCRNCAM